MIDKSSLGSRADAGQLNAAAKLFLKFLLLLKQQLRKANSHAAKTDHAEFDVFAHAYHLDLYVCFLTNVSFVAKVSRYRV
jgi:hypothetical protein